MPCEEDTVLACDKCPRTFKLQEFYDKHQKVHLLKKQHVCSICGFVYGAAKGLEGHMDSAHRNVAAVSPAATDLSMAGQQRLLAQTAKPAAATALHELPFGLGFQLLQQRLPNGGGVSTLDQARLAQESASLLQKAHQAMLAAQQATQNSAAAAARTANMAAGLTMVPLSIEPSSISPISTSGDDDVASPASRAAREDKNKIPSPAGTGNYRIYGMIVNKRAREREKEIGRRRERKTDKR